MSFDYKPPKKKPSKIWNAIKVVSDYSNPIVGIGKNLVAPKIKKHIKKAYTQYYKAPKVGQSKGPAGGPTSITKKTPKFRKPFTKSSPQYEHPIWKGPFPFKRNK